MNYDVQRRRRKLLNQRHQPRRAKPLSPSDALAIILLSTVVTFTALHLHAHKPKINKSARTMMAKAIMVTDNITNHYGH